MTLRRVHAAVARRLQGRSTGTEFRMTRQRPARTDANQRGGTTIWKQEIGF